MSRELYFGVIGAGFMGKAHALALHSVAAVFGLETRPVVDMIATSSDDSAARAAKRLGFARHTGDWRELVRDPAIDVVTVCAPLPHREMVLEAIAHGKHVLCEKPLATNTGEAAAMQVAAEQAGVVCMVGFNYPKTPASQFARQLIDEGALGEIVSFRCAHVEDFLADPDLPMDWRMRRAEAGEAGALGDLGSHCIGMAHWLLGPIREVMAETRIVHAHRPAPDSGERVAVENDDQAELLVRFKSDVSGSLYVSRVGTGHKMGLSYEVTGTEGTIVFDQERLSEIQFYSRRDDARTQGFRRIPMGPSHPDYGDFCPAPGHGTGYNDTVTVEVRDLIAAITGEQPKLWPTFADAVYVHRVVDAALASVRDGRWTVVG
ncbi:Gfo/Idh/MocA family protein [Salinisphaera sp. LB1]|uniref:Gfo/Idh/MocA family protein n=1 Tax=Salinisphaera sp. LB1 TaxID=2183911 RepID=UPI000D705459|nr:Gfo/Idh/MocA family oxidoreductase [Salinisphaera sp. LB1]AWN17853.1 Myo-inositol 2-dehydrogenase 2 [Salinisphaera sp. LB1]